MPAVHPAMTPPHPSVGLSCSDAELLSRLFEDVPFGDLTTASLGLAGRPAEASFAAGGAVTHRLGLSETLHIFPEHRAFIEAAQQADAVPRLRRMQPEKRVVVEVGSHDDAIAMARAGADVLQLERFTPAQLGGLRAALAGLSLQPMLAPAGGVTLANAVEYARGGADFLVSSAPYFAAPADIRVRIRPGASSPQADH